MSDGTMERRNDGSGEQSDREIDGLLRSHFGNVPADVDHEALSARIVAAAELRLRARAKRAGWRAPASRWARIAIPAGLAASIALILGLALADGPPGDVALEEVVAVAASEALPANALGATEQEVFLAAVLGNGE